MVSRRWLLLSCVVVGIGCLLLAAKALHVPSRLRYRLQTLTAKVTSAESLSDTAVEALPPVDKNFSVAQEVYSGGLKNDWKDWGWSDRVVTGPGPAKIDFTDYGGWILHHSPQSGPFGAVVFRMKAPKDSGTFLEIRLASELTTYEPLKLTSRYLFPEADGWVLAVVPWYELNPYGQPFDGIRIRGFRKVTNANVELDRISLAAPQAGEAPIRKFPTRDETVTIRCSSGSTEISPLIFGIGNRVPPEDMGATAYRFGGNPTSRFNWETRNMWNTGSDWYFRNVNVKSWQELFLASTTKNIPLTVTMPLLGWVARDDRSYSFPVTKYGRQQKSDPEHPDIGNGVDLDGKEIRAEDPLRTSIAASPEMVGEWVQKILAESVAHGQPVHSYILDNEPCLWNSTHRDVHPVPLGYDELLERTIAYGTAIRKADPQAIIAGPAEWGWSNYFWSSKDLVAGYRIAPDRRAHGGTPLLEWYLQKLLEHEKKTGVHILDLVDLHFYPQGKEVYGDGGATNLDVAKLRIRSTRGLWDPTYVDESWIKDRVQLIPRMKDIIARNYPGRGISIGEWNFGAEGHISGGLATAEALGRFAEGGVHSAYYWTIPPAGTPAYWAFRAFRNFDGKGSAFQNRFIQSTAPKDASVFASRDANANRYVAVVLVFTHTHAMKVKFDVATCGAIDSWKTLVYSGRPEGFVPSKHGTSGEITDTLPPFSMTVLDFTTKREQPAAP